MGLVVAVKRARMRSMKRMPNMLMAGAAGRNLGKTQFLCQAIRRQSEQFPVVGIKVTAFDDVEGEIQPDRLRTRTYRTIKGDFVVTREKPGDDNKDTHRMYRAGAERVYWLRAKRSHLEQGLDALLKAMTEDEIDLETACLVCESGGSRNFIHPGLFFIIQEHHDAMKPSCHAVAHLADRLVNVDGDGWDLQPEDLVFEKGQWSLKEEAAAIVLSGGTSRRMGEDKSVMHVHGQPLVSTVAGQLAPHFDQLIVSGSEEKYAFTGYKVVEDLKAGQGPLMGLMSALKASDHELNFVTACDIPNIHLPFVRRMLREIGDHDAVVPVLPDGHKQPLFAVYRKDVHQKIEACLTNGKRAVHALLDILDVHCIDIEGDWYHNLNTREDLETYRENRT